MDLAFSTSLSQLIGNFRALTLHSEYNNVPGSTLRLRMLSTFVFVTPHLVRILHLVVAYPYNSFPQQISEEIIYGHFIQMGRRIHGSHYLNVIWNNFYLFPQGLPRSTS